MAPPNNGMEPTPQGGAPDAERYMGRKKGTFYFIVLSLTVL
jgi:hypothetical protein